MTIQQILFVLEIYNTGSITQAAKNLFVSQPNVSNALKNLEQELGYTILTRGKNGISFTSEGIEFVRHGRSVIEHMEKITEVSTRDSNHRFNLVSNWYPPAEYAYFRLCMEYESKPKVQFTIRNANQYESLDMLYENSCDIALVISNNLSRPFYQEELNSKRLRYVQLGRVQANVNIARNHPLLEKEPFAFEKLWEYSYVKYRDNSGREDYSKELPFINPQKIISVDSREIRSLVVTNSTAYSIGVPLPEKRIQELGWDSVPIPNGFIEIGYVVSNDHESTPITQRYIELLLEETRFLDEQRLYSQLDPKPS